MNLNLGHINSIASVNVILKDDSYLFNVVVIKKKKGLLQITSQGNNIDSVKDLLKITGKYCSFILHFSGKGILNKKVENTPNYRSKIFMNANLDDFYFTDVESKDSIFTSVIRKSVAQEVVNLFNPKLNHVLSVCSGPFIAQIIKSQLPFNTLLSNEYELTYNEQDVVGFEKLKENRRKNYDLDGKQINQNLVPAVSHGTLFFMPNDRYILPIDSSLSEAKLETEQKNIFIRFGAFMIIFFIIILLGNMIYLNKLNKTIQINSQELALSEQTLQRVGTLSEEENRKTKMLRSSGLMNKQFLAFFLKELSNSTPSEINFDRISIRPFVNEIKNNFKIEINENIIYVLGETPTSNILSEWIIEIKQKSWIGKIDILNYVYSKGVGEFELKIEIINV